MSDAQMTQARLDDRRMLGESVDGFTRRATNMQRVRGWQTREPGYDKTVWKEMAELGWAGLLVPEQFSGSGLGLGEMAVVAQGLARHLMPEPLVSTAVLAVRALTLAENEFLNAKLLPRIAGGDLIAALAFQEQAGDLAGQTPGTTASLKSSQIQLDGSKRFVAGAAGADGFIVSGASESGTMLVWVPADTPGLSVALEPLADGRFSGTLSLQRVNLPESHVLAPGQMTQGLLNRVIDEGTVIVAAELVGVMDRALQMTLEYLRTRVQFGRALGSFQALQHRCVDLFIQQQLAEAVLHEALNALDEQPESASTVATVSRAKARCNDAAALITRQAIQMHGGIGFTEDSDVGLYVKRALTLIAWLGNSTHHRRRYNELLTQAGAQHTDAIDDSGGIA